MSEKDKERNEQGGNAPHPSGVIPDPKAPQPSGVIPDPEGKKPSPESSAEGEGEDVGGVIPDPE